MNKALLAIEEAYDIALNPELDYLAQLQELAVSGELSNKITMQKVLFKLCMIVDIQEKEIKELKEDRIAIANKMLELEGGKTNATPATETRPDPTAPLQS